MRLRRVKIFGFKTFAEKAEFEIAGEFVAVVGPNGSGKSNIVDAILWGLGEGNSRHLRAQSGTDVIFNGSSRRKAVGYAEVSLLFDNEDGALPIPTSEVTVTRRLTRAGESEYSINRQNCRLRDVLELLADSGLGRAGYAIVGQKEIDQALAASVEDRRAWVDEAAGVQRYRARKVESLRRLVSAKDHLSRVADILKEIESQREPLAAEAEVAIRYKSALTSLREVESGLLISEVIVANTELDKLASSLQSSAATIRKENDIANRADDEISRIGNKISVIESDLDSLRATLQSTLTQIERLESTVQLGHQRLKSFEELEANFEDEAERAKTRLDEMRSEIETLEKEWQTEESEFSKISEECVGVGESASKLKLELAQAESQLESGRKVHNQGLQVEAEQRHRSVRQKEIKRELDSAKKNVADVESASKEATEQFETVSSKLKETEQQLQAKVEAVANIQRASQSRSQSLRNELAQQASLEGRKRGIEATIESHEGLAQGPKAVLDAVEAGDLSGEFVPVGEAISVGKDVALAIEVALGASSNDLICDTEEDAKRAIEYLKANRAGRATFQPIPLMRPHHLPPEAKAASERKGAIAFANTLVDCEPRFQPVIDALLGRILIVESLQIALQLAKTNGWSRLVTLEGEVVHSGGAVTGGNGARISYGVVQRKADLESIEGELAEISAKVRKAEMESAGESRQIEELETQIAGLKEVLETQKTELAEASQWASQVHHELLATRKEIEKLERESAALQSQDSTSTEFVDLQSLEMARDRALHAFAALSADAEVASARIHEADSRRKIAAERMAGSERKLAALEEAEGHRIRKTGNLGPERDRALHEIEAAKKSQVEAYANRIEVEAKLASGSDQKRQLLEKSFELSEQAKAARANSQAVSDALHQAELNRARMESKLAAALQRLIEEYSITEEAALEMQPPTDIPSDASQIVSRLRREIRSMGDVNVGAIEAYERMTSRHTELSEQTKDIEAGISDVEAGIKELDNLTRGRFEETFSSVQEAFEEIFVRLFPEGNGQLQLSNPSNLLESGIEIDVQLPGKKRQRLELLSGGERSLCATAFLFALLKVKPSPLVVLDEVDAPLDGRNVERFIELLRDFSKEIQFIVITHNTSTIAAAPVWLGVTMSEPGVSTLVPVRIPDSSRQAALL